MRAVDTNVLVRLIARDDESQARQAEAFVGRGGWVSQLVLAETIWVLESVYGLDRRQTALTVDMLLEHEQLVVQGADAVEAALAEFKRRRRVGFTDCLVIEIARKAGHTPVGTFDRAMAQLEGARRV